jgi:hypothetical protein
MGHLQCILTSTVGSMVYAQPSNSGVDASAAALLLMHTHHPALWYLKQWHWWSTGTGSPCQLVNGACAAAG